MKNRTKNTLTLTAVALCAAAMLPVTASAEDGKWGTIKGKVVFDKKAAKLPENPKVVVAVDKMHCESNGAIRRNEIVINPKNRGVRYALVFLGDPKDPDNLAFAPPIHPQLKKFAPTVEIDQPCCVFEPRMTVLRLGQDLVVKNSGKVSHNFSINTIGVGPKQNILLTAGDKKTVKGFAPTKVPTMYSCNIHGWMKGWIAVVPHPYFAVTDEDGNFEIKNAPAGTFRLQVYHEAVGWVAMTGKTRGKSVTIKAGTTTDAGTFEVEPE